MNAFQYKKYFVRQRIVKAKHTDATIIMYIIALSVTPEPMTRFRVTLAKLNAKKATTT